MPKSFAVEVRTVSCAPGVWTGNGVRYATEAAANTAANDISWRWTAVESVRVVESDDAPNREG